MHDDLILGIDGGGSKTLVALADATGRVVRLTRGAAANPLDNSGWRDVLDNLLRPIIRASSPGSVAAALPVFGEVEAISDAQRRVVAALAAPGASLVLNDVDAAHLGAFGGEAGILILSGTGSMAWARDAAGKSYRTGGWGEVIGDEGSSHWIGHRILGAVSKAHDGRGPATALVDALLDELQIEPDDVVNGIVGWVSRLVAPRAQIAALAPLATRLAEAGDSVARQIVETAADELADHITAIARLTGLPTIWSCAGGTFESGLLRDMIASRIGSAPLPLRLPPVGGALLAAARNIGWKIDDSWIERLAASLQSTPITPIGPQLSN